MTKLGRNDLCHCGSGQKYKRCCLGKDEAAAARGSNFDPTTVDIQELIQAMTWSNESHRELAVDLIANMEGRYEPDTLYFALVLWNQYAAKTQPVYRKPGVYAAAIEFFFNGGTMTELAERYDVSPTSLSKRYQEIFDFALTLSIGGNNATAQR
ncbi:hypothetical protein FHS18_004115 [Paenibacillus phyllosphaerae]|uniref:SEC-C motif-containing protein n=1 Tax=Paenibacillus phyllosphaerae TaxID=274593 RepID=A0A7W5B0I5_9BACL|nr:hypothetical protein [Paenibacillus phyllosphaerae]